MYDTILVLKSIVDLWTIVLRAVLSNKSRATVSRDLNVTYCVSILSACHPCWLVGNSLQTVQSVSRFAAISFNIRFTEYRRPKISDFHIVHVYVLLYKSSWWYDKTAYYKKWGLHTVCNISFLYTWPFDRDC